MFSQQLAKFKNETKIKTSLRARGPPAVSGALRSLRILRIGRIGSVYVLRKKRMSDQRVNETFNRQGFKADANNVLFCT